MSCMQYSISLFCTTFIFVSCSLFADDKKEQQPVNEKKEAKKADPRSEQLFAAARKGDTAEVKKLLEDGVDVNSKTEYGATALSYACDKGHLEVVKILLDNKADMNLADTFYGATPMTWAMMRDQNAIVKELISYGFKNPETMLVSFARSNAVEVVKVILEKSKPSATQLTAAWKATKNNDIIELLKKAGAKEPVIEAEKKSLDEFTGTFKHATLGEVTLENVKGTLIVKSGSQQILTLVQEKDEKFKAEGSNTIVEFRRKDKTIDSFVVKLEGMEERIYLKVAVSSTTEKDPKIAAQSDEIKGVCTQPANWPQFRGNGANGVADGQFPPTYFDAVKGDNLRWKTPIPGLGHSCPVVWAGKIYLTTAISGDAKATLRPGQYGDVDSVKDNTRHSWHVYCIDHATGKVEWSKQLCDGVPKVKRHLKGTHANPTISTDGKVLVVSFAAEGLFGLSMLGEQLWKRDLGKLDSGWFYDPDYQWGFGSSPIVTEGKVVVQVDAGKESFLAAYEIKSGKTIWQTNREEIPSWGTPTAIDTPSGKIIVTNATKFARGYDANHGKEIWKISKNSEITVPTPFLANGLIWVCSGYRPIQPIYAIKPTAQGDLTLKDKQTTNDGVAWSKAKGGPYMPTPIVYGEHLYVCSNSGILTCYETATGKQLYNERLGGAGGYTGSPVAADGRIYFAGEENGVRVVKAGGTFELLAINPLGEICMTTPAISNGLILIRTEKHLMAFGKK